MPTPMPTAAKAVAAVSFAVVGWLIADAYIANMTEETAMGPFRELTAALGLIIGYRVMGPSVGNGYVGAVGSGWKTVIVLVFFTLLFFAIYQMILQSTKMLYDGPFEAVLDVFNQMMKRSVPFGSVGVIMVMAIGGAVAGILAENANRRWR
jgi:hypothetical protein